MKAHRTNEMRDRLADASCLVGDLLRTATPRSHNTPRSNNPAAAAVLAALPPPCPAPANDSSAPQKSAKKVVILSPASLTRNEDTSVQMVKAAPLTLKLELGDIDLRSNVANFDLSGNDCEMRDLVAEDNCPSQAGAASMADAAGAVAPTQSALHTSARKLPTPTPPPQGKVWNSSYPGPMLQPNPRTVELELGGLSYAHMRDPVMQQVLETGLRATLVQTTGEAPPATSPPAAEDAGNGSSDHVNKMYEESLKRMKLMTGFDKPNKSMENVDKMYEKTLRRLKALEGNTPRSKPPQLVFSTPSDVPPTPDNVPLEPALGLLTSREKSKATMMETVQVGGRQCNPIADAIRKLADEPDDQPLAKAAFLQRSFSHSPSTWPQAFGTHSAAQLHKQATHGPALTVRATETHAPVRLTRVRSHSPRTWPVSQNLAQTPRPIYVQ